LEVSLTFGELASAAMVGVYRQLESIRKGGKDQTASKDSPFTIHIHGAMAEQAVAKHLGLHWCSGVNTFADPDINPGIQVKWRSYDQGDMYIPVKAKDDEVYILVTGQPPTFTIRGFISVPEAKQFPVKAPGGFKPAHCVPQCDLRPISEFPRQ
jgi:hypothetical protein